jgi:hypothetical protein
MPSVNAEMEARSKDGNRAIYEAAAEAARKGEEQGEYAVKAKRKKEI